MQFIYASIFINEELKRKYSTIVSMVYTNSGINNVLEENRFFQAALPKVSWLKDKIIVKEQQMPVKVKVLEEVYKGHGSQKSEEPVLNEYGKKAKKDKGGEH